MSVKKNWWSCSHLASDIALLEDQNTGDNFYACGACGLEEGEGDLTKKLVQRRLSDIDHERGY